MKYIIFLCLLTIGFTTSQPVPLPPEVKTVKRTKQIVTQGAGSELLIKKNLVVVPKRTTNYMVFRFPTNVNMKVWHNVVTWISMDGTNWGVFGTNVIETSFSNAKVPLFIRQEVLL